MRVFLALLLLLLAQPCFAFEIEGDKPNRTLVDLIGDFVDIPEGATDWRVLGKTKETLLESTFPDGSPVAYYQPTFTPEVKALDGQIISVKGFMFPLDSTEEQQHFLFGPFPVNCPYQYHVGSSLVIEVNSVKPITFTYDALTITGKLELVAEDKEFSTFYRLHDAKITK